MAGDTRNVPVWYWMLAAAALFWEGVGCVAYLTQVGMDAADLAALPQAQADAYAGMAAWQWAAFAIAVWVGLAGAVGLLLRRKWAAAALLVSLIASVIMYGYLFLATNFLDTIAAAEALPLPLTIIVIGAILVWFANHASRRGWLK